MLGIECKSVWVKYCCFFFNGAATTELYTLSLHDALQIWPKKAPEPGTVTAQVVKKGRAAEREGIRGMKVLLREDLHFLLHHAIFLEFLMQGLAGDPQTPGSLALISIGEFKGLQYGPLFHLL